jgi:hypothetical protein
MFPPNIHADKPEEGPTLGPEHVATIIIKLNFYIFIYYIIYLYYVLTYFAITIALYFSPLSFLKT